MTVSDPLLRLLKGIVKKLRAEESIINDNNCNLLPLCETIEHIFRKGLKQTVAVFGRFRKDYWNCILECSKKSIDRSNAVFSMVVNDVEKKTKVLSSTGRGRLFIRCALNKSVLVAFINILRSDYLLRDTWYDGALSIIGDEILSEILVSVLLELSEIEFKLSFRNCSFLDDTWTLPVYRFYEIVPCKDLGVTVHYIDGRVLVTAVVTDSVAGEDNKVSVGDLFDELCGISLRNVKKGKISSIMRDHLGFPIYLGVTKLLTYDGSHFLPHLELIHKAVKLYPSLKYLFDKKESIKTETKLPLHAQLPFTDDEELPVHESDGCASFKVEYLGKVILGNSGTVNFVEVAIKELLEKNNIQSQELIMELGETDVIVKRLSSDDVLYKHSYTEISSCGRRNEDIEIFAYIAGETTCTLAKKFTAHIYKADSEFESKTILCTIAQGFGRTHWLM